MAIHWIIKTFHAKVRFKIYSLGTIDTDKSVLRTMSLAWLKIQGSKLLSEFFLIFEYTSYSLKAWKPTFSISFSLWTLRSYMNTIFNFQPKFEQFWRFLSVFCFFLCYIIVWIMTNSSVNHWAYVNVKLLQVKQVFELLQGTDAVIWQPV